MRTERNNPFLVIAASSGLLAVGLGAFGAHGLKKLVDVYSLQIWDKGVQYQFYHSLALSVIYMLLQRQPSSHLRNAGWCFLAGIVGFSGSLYLLATISLNGMPGKLLGPITPIGGSLFILGWVFVLLESIKDRKSL